MSKRFKSSLVQQLKDSEFKAEWDRSEPEAQIMKVMLKVHRQKGLTQKELA